MGNELVPTKEAVEKKPNPVSVPIENGVIMPSDVDGLWRLSCLMAQSGWMPKGVNGPEQVFVCVQAGLEIGLSPMQAVQGIACINGRPAIWGDAQLGVVQASGLLEQLIVFFTGEQYQDPYTAICIAKRKGFGELYQKNMTLNEARQEGLFVNAFSVAEAKTAGLWKKAGTWTTYPSRMLKNRARAFSLRDAFSDVLKGLKSVEEVMDYAVDAFPGQDGVYKTQRTAQELTASIKEVKPAIAKEEEGSGPQAGNPPAEIGNPFDNSDNWKNFRTGKEGLSTFFYKHEASWEAASIAAQQAFIEKWVNCYGPDQPFPGTRSDAHQDRQEPNSQADVSDEDVDKGKLIAEIVDLKKGFSNEYEQAKKLLGLEDVNTVTDMLALKAKMNELIDTDSAKDEEGMP